MIRRRPSVRLTLTLWYSAALVCVLALYAAIVFAAFERDLLFQLDALLHEDVEHVTTEIQTGGVNPLAEEDEWAEVWAGGQVLYRSPEAERRPLPGLPPPVAPAVKTVRLDGGRYLRVRDEPETVNGARSVVRVAEPEDELRSRIASLAWIMGLGVPLAAVLAAAAGYHLARRALSPVHAMAERAQAISAERLHERVPVGNADDELGRLARVMNDLLGRLEQSFAQMQRFTSDASHELRTPLTAIRTVGEVGLKGDKGEAGYRETIGSMLEEAERLTRLVDAMLMLSRADAGRIPVNRNPASVTELVEEVTQQLGVLAEEKNQAIAVSSSGATTASIDPMILRMAIVNLVDNAIRYSGAGTGIDVSVMGGDRSVEVAVRDEGPGISPVHQRRLFERFYRVDDARSRQSGGAGLGLSIARWAVEAHDGRLDVMSEPGAGSTFRVTLPR